MRSWVRQRDGQGWTVTGQGPLILSSPELCRALSGCSWGRGVGPVRAGLGRCHVWGRLTSGEGGGDVDLGDSERYKGEELVRATG